MKVKGRIELPLLSFLKGSAEDVEPTIKKWLKDQKKIMFTITGEASIEDISMPGMINLLPAPNGENACDVMIETWYQKRTLTQLNTLKALESILYQIDYQRKPKSSDLDYIHQGILEMANIKIENPWTKKTFLLRTSSTECTTKHMNRFIEIALEELSLRDIDDDIRDALFDRPMSDIFKSWYKQRMVKDDLDGLTWKEYRERIPYCEFTFKTHTAATPLERMHIISAGANGKIYEESWNWIHAQRHIHQKQHQYGWDPILQDYPHLKPKVERALQKERELESND